MVEFTMDEYKTVYSADASKFDKEINELLKEGWELYGSPYALMNTNEALVKHQALVKYVVADLRAHRLSRRLFR